MDEFLIIKNENIEKLDSLQSEMLYALAEKVEDGKEYLVLDLDTSLNLSSLNVDVSNLRMSGSFKVQIRDIAEYLLEAIEKGENV